MLKSPIGNMTVTLPVSGGLVSMPPPTINGGTHYLVFAGGTVDASGNRYSFYGDHLARTNWSTQAVPEAYLATLDVFLAAPALPIDESLLIAPQTQLNAATVSGFTFPMTYLSLNIIIYG